MPVYKTKHKICFKLIAIGAVCLFLLNDIAFALAPPTRFKPIPCFVEEEPGKYKIIENEKEKSNLIDTSSFEHDVAFLYLSQLIGQALYLPLSADGVIELIKRDLSHIHPNLENTAYRWRELYKDGDKFCLPYEGASGRQILKLCPHDGRPVASPDRVPIPMENAYVILEDPLEKKPREVPREHPVTFFDFIYRPVLEGKEKKPFTLKQLVVWARVSGKTAGENLRKLFNANLIKMEGAAENPRCAAILDSKEVISALSEKLSAIGLKDATTENIKTVVAQIFMAYRWRKPLYAILERYYDDFGYLDMWDGLSANVKLRIEKYYGGLERVKRKFLQEEPERILKIAEELAQQRYYEDLMELDALYRIAISHPKIQKIYRAMLPDGTIFEDFIKAIRDEKARIDELIDKYGLPQELHKVKQCLTEKEVYYLIKGETLGRVRQGYTRNIRQILKDVLLNDEKRAPIARNRLTALADTEPQDLVDGLFLPLRSGNPLRKREYQLLFWVFLKSEFGKSLIERLHIRDTVPPPDDSLDTLIGPDLTKPEEDIRDEFSRGDAAGKFYADRDTTVVAKGDIGGEVKGNTLRFYDGKTGKPLYNEDSHEIYAKIKKTKDPRYPHITVLHDNKHVWGYADDKNIYITREFLDEELLRYHEERAHYYAKNPDKLPSGINAHTKIRGCGQGIRGLVRHGLTRGGLKANFDAENLINYLKRSISKNRINESEFALIEWNQARGKEGIALIYGEADEDPRFGPVINESLTWTHICRMLYRIIKGARPEERDYKKLEKWMRPQRRDEKK